MDRIDWYFWWQVWCWGCGIFCMIWPLARGGKKPAMDALTDDERWQVFHAMCDRPQLMADGRTFQKIEWRYVPCAAPVSGEAPAAQQKAPPVPAPQRA
jgi:hypothetical protein